MVVKKSDEASSANQNSGDASFSDEVLKLAQCLMPVPPSAKVKHLLDSSAVEAKLSEVAWKAYDSIVGLANQTTNSVYGNRRVAQILGGSIDLMLRWQRFNSAVAGALFAAIWPAVDLPTGSEVAAVRADIRELRQELRAALAEAEINEDYARELHEVVRNSIANEQDVADQVRKSRTQQISTWTGAEQIEMGLGGAHTEINDVGN